VRDHVGVVDGVHRREVAAVERVVALFMSASRWAVRSVSWVEASIVALFRVCLVSEVSVGGRDARISLYTR
jgi:hypothetical protein